MNALLLDISFFCLLFIVTRLSLCRSGETHVSSTCFCTRKEGRFCQQARDFHRIRMDNNHATHRSRIKPFDIVKPDVALTCTPGFEWIIMCEDCLAHCAPLWSKRDRCVPGVELQTKGQLVCTPTVRTRSDVRPQISRLAQSVFFFFCARHRQNDDDSDLKDGETASGKQGLQSKWRDCEDEFGNES